MRNEGVDAPAAVQPAGRADEVAEGEVKTMRRNHIATITCGALFLGLGLGNAGTASAQAGVYAYPNAGQSEQQQAQDRFECHQWAVQQSGFDPTTAPPLPQQAHSGSPPPPPPQQQPRSRGFLGLGDGGFFEGGGMLGDAATGAGLGAAGGAIAGDAGEGAAIGAIAGTLFGALSRGSQQTQQPSAADRDYYYQQQQAQQAQQAQLDQVYLERREKSQSYQRAYGACMNARNYTVQ